MTDIWVKPSLHSCIIQTFASAFTYSLRVFLGKEKQDINLSALSLLYLNVNIPALWDTKRTSFKRLDTDFSSWRLRSVVSRCWGPGWATWRHAVVLAAWLGKHKSPEPRQTQQTPTVEPLPSGCRGSVRNLSDWLRRDSRSTLCPECRSSPTQKCSWKHTSTHTKPPDQTGARHTAVPKKCFHTYQKNYN